ncbi:LysR family transcriptional regulator [Paraburkholderia franconis]|uniref:LysR family transcriptional regulator n=1 Tax=Paraburkholderia franconis TaxID=2654983 RepID=UPI00128DBFB9|nr:LysR family transcriptional regulator [Paraburkholderia franconis]
MNLRQFEHLVALADEGAFARAAEKVHLTQSALTRSIQSLEDELGMRLCDRHPRGIVLTPGGKLVVERARRALFEIRALDRDVKLFNNHELGEVMIGAGPIPAAALLSDTIAVLARSNPRLSVHVSVDDWVALLERLHAETIDFMITVESAVSPSPELAIRPLPSCRCGWFARPEHPIFSRSRRRISMLRELRVASVPAPKHTLENLRKLMQRKPFEQPMFAVECNSFHMLKELATDSDMVIYGPFSAVWRELDSGALRTIDFEDSKELTTRFAIVSLAHRTLSPSAEKAIEIIVECNGRLEERATKNRKKSR